MLAEERGRDRERWVARTRELLANELSDCQHRLLGHLLLFLGRFEGQHGCGSGVCGIFAPVLLPHVPPTTVLLRDLLLDAALIFPEHARSVDASFSRSVRHGGSLRGIIERMVRWRAYALIEFPRILKCIDLGVQYALEKKILFFYSVIFKKSFVIICAFVLFQNSTFYPEFWWIFYNFYISLIKIVE